MLISLEQLEEVILKNMHYADLLVYHESFSNIKSEQITGIGIDEGYSKFWLVNGKLHRADGPAIEFTSGTKEWYKDGNLHREDGPAVEYSTGSKEWYLNGVFQKEDIIC